MLNHRNVYRSALAMIAACLSIVAFRAAPAEAAPQGEQVVAGEASFTRDGAQTIIEAANNTIIDYQSFDIGLGEAVRFIQPTDQARVLNRVLDARATVIDGTLTANGRVYLVNPSGIMFGDQAIVDVGHLTAAAGNMSNSDFLAGVNRFTGLGGEVTNRGLIRGRNVDLIGQHVQNFGSIVVDDGMVTMLAGDEVYLGDGQSPVLVKVSDAGDGEGDDGTTRPGVHNAGTVRAGSGKVVMGAADAYALAIRHSGEARARQIKLSGPDGQVQVTGLLDASDEAWAAENRRGGTVHVLGREVVVAGDAVVDASGDQGGGKIRIGGDLRGEGTLYTAEYTYVGPDVTIDASTGSNGDGGTAIVWADIATAFFGAVDVRGGGAVDHGGFVEISGAQYLTADGVYQIGPGGTLLFDPAVIEIRGGIADGNDDTASNNSYFESEELVIDNAGFNFGIVPLDDYNAFNPFVVYESEIEGEFVTPAGNIVLEAREEIYTAGDFVDSNNDGIGDILVDFDVIGGASAGDRPAPSGMGLELRTRNNAADGPGGIDLTRHGPTPMAIQVRNGAELIIEASTSGESTGDILVDVLIADDTSTIDINTLNGSFTNRGAITGNEGAISIEAATDAAINQPITTTDGEIDIMIGNDITFGPTGSIASDTGDLMLIADADGDADGTGGGITMVGATTIDTGSGEITISADETIQLGQLTTTSATPVGITSTSEGILDANGAAINVAAPSVSLLAATHIGRVNDVTAGTGNALELELGASLDAATITEAGGTIYLDFGATLPTFTNPIIVDADGDATAIVEADPDIDLTAGAGLGDFFTLDPGDGVGVRSGGTLTIPDAGFNRTAPLYLQGDVDVVDNGASPRELDLIAPTLVLASGAAGGDTTLNTTADTLTASLSGAGHLSVVETDGLVLTASTADGAIDITAPGPLTLVDVDASAVDADANDITVTNAGGAADVTIDRVAAGPTAGDVTITADGAIVENPDSAVDIEGDVITLAAAGGIGVGQPIEIAGQSLSVNTTAAGDVELNETDDLVVTSITASDGSVVLNAGGDLAIDLIDVGAAQNVTLDAGGAISENPDPAVDIFADTLDLSAQTGIGAGEAIEIEVNTLTADSQAGHIELVETDAITLTSVIAGNGAIQIDAGDAMTATLVRSQTDDDANDITLTTASGDLVIDLVDAGGTGGDVTLAAAGALVENPDPDVDIRGDVVDLTAQSIGAAEALEIDVNTLSAQATGLAPLSSIALVETDDMMLDTVSTQNGNVALTTMSGRITDAADDDVVDITTTDLYLEAPDGVGLITSFVDAAGNALDIDVSGTLTGVLVTNAGGQINLNVGPALPTIAANAIVIAQNGAGEAILQSTASMDASTAAGGFDAQVGDALGLVADDTLTIPDAGFGQADLRILLVGGADVVDDGATPRQLEVVADQFSLLTGASGGVTTTVDVDSDQINVQATNDSDLVVNPLGAATLEKAVLNQGSILVNAPAPLTINTIDIANTDDGTHTVEANTAAGDLLVGVINAGSQNDVTLNAAADLADAPGKIIADVLTATAGGAMTLDTTVNSVDAQTSAAGNLRVTETDGIVLTNLDTTAGDGDIFVRTVNSPMTLVRLRSGNRNITLRSAGTIDGTADATTDLIGAGLDLSGTDIGTTTQVSLIASSLFNASASGSMDLLSEADLVVHRIQAGQDALVESTQTITGTGELFPNFWAMTVDLTANGVDPTNAAIGTAANPLEVLALGQLNADASSVNGDIYINYIGVERPGTIDPGAGMFFGTLLIPTNLAVGLPGSLPASVTPHADPYALPNADPFANAMPGAPTGDYGVTPLGSAMGVYADEQTPAARPLPTLTRLDNRPLHRFFESHQRAFTTYDQLQAAQWFVLTHSLFEARPRPEAPSFAEGYLDYLQHTATTGEAEPALDAARTLSGLHEIARNLQLRGMYRPGYRTQRLRELADFTPDGMTGEQLDQVLWNILSAPENVNQGDDDNDAIAALSAINIATD